MPQGAERSLFKQQRNKLITGDDKRIHFVIPSIELNDQSRSMERSGYCTTFRIRKVY